MATSLRQLEANRRNALRSTGPRTEEGKAAVSLNALRHGLRTETAILPHEDPELFDELRAGFLADFAPQSNEELRWVDELAMGAWRLRRFVEMEVRVLTPHFELENVEAEPHVRMNNAHAMLNDMVRLGRYHSSIYRAYDRALKELLTIQQERKRQPDATPEPPVQPEPPATPFSNPTHPSQLPPDLASRWPRDRNRQPIKPNMQQKFWQNYFQVVRERQNPVN